MIATMTHLITRMLSQLIFLLLKKCCLERNQQTRIFQEEDFLSQPSTIMFFLIPTIEV